MVRSGSTCSRLTDLLRNRLVPNIIASVKCVRIETTFCRKVNTTLTRIGRHSFEKASVTLIKIAATKKKYL